MTKRIIYPTPTGIAIIIPTDELPIEVVARKDVPQGVAYRIIDTATVPTDRTFRSAWEADFTSPDGFGDPATYWTEKEVAEQAKREAEVKVRQTVKEISVPLSLQPARRRVFPTNPMEAI